MTTRMKTTAKATMKTTAQDDLLRIPGVGKSIAQDLRDLGVTRVNDLRGRDSEA